ncbi:acyltransferase family protein [Alkaliphilus transvaalensis]|uniref:acyltransferase family protein n=1 Tax=Alkaliphilus transvaalensis TaxID=114628 RepID=UPI00047BC173|nr:acyltransferase family protein [Alkaliphilus transvaalensis]
MGTNVGKKDIKEIYFVRSIVCLCVVLVHSITRVNDLYTGIQSPQSELLLLCIRLIFTFGTPIFIFLSEFLLAYSYPNEMPSNFMGKRVKYILMPYVSMSFLYGFVMVWENGVEGYLFGSYMVNVLMNLAFGFYRHGYFILVIFQFYFIHILFHKKLRLLNPIKVILVSFLINVIYLGFFSFIHPPAIPFGNQLWDGLSWGTFPSWIFYFTLGFYIGGDYQQFKTLLRKYKKVIKVLPIFTGSIVLYLYLKGMITFNSSKRVDMILFSTSMLFLLFYISTAKVKIPKIAQWFSGYSFGIYLFHMLYLASLTGILMDKNYYHISPVIMLFLLFCLSTLLSIFTTYVLGKLPFGVYIVGKTPNNSNKIRIIDENYSKIAR